MTARADRTQIRPARQDDAERIVALVRASNDLHGYPGSHFDADALLRDVFGPNAILVGHVAEHAQLGSSASCCVATPMRAPSRRGAPTSWTSSSTTEVAVRESRGA